MKKIYMIFLFVIACSIFGCYEDTGNYDYKDIQEIEIKFGTTYVSTAIDEVVEVESKLNIDIDETSPNHTFQWSIDGDTKPEWNKKNFTWKVDKAYKDAYLMLEVKDKRNNMVYQQRVPLSVVGIYEFDDSWIILSDKGGESILSFLSVMKTEDNDETDQTDITKSRFFANVFEDANNGMKLGNGPIAIQEHFRVGVDHNDDVVGNVCIFQQSGAVDMSGVNFEKELDLNEVFDGGTYPVGAVIRPGSFMTIIDVLSDQYGRLYSRIKASDKVFHSEYFFQEPLKAMGEKDILTNCKIVRGYHDTNRIPYEVIYDGGKKRMLTIYTKNDDYEGTVLPETGRIDPVWGYKDDVDVSGIVPLNDMTGYDVLHMNKFEIGESDEYGYNIVMKEVATNKLYLQWFVTSHPWGAPVRLITSVGCNEIIGLPTTPSIMAFPIYEDQEYAFFAIGKILYMLNTKNISKAAEIYYTFESNITALNYDSRFNQHLAVGLEDGSFFILGVIKAKELDAKNKVIYTAPEKVGRIVDIHFKNNDAWNY